MENTASSFDRAPPGYVSYDDGQLTEAVRRKPTRLYCLTRLKRLLTMCLMYFLQILDDGRLTDGKGRTVDFRNTIIIDLI